MRLPAGGVEAVGTLPEPDEDVLQHLFGHRVVAEHPASQAVHAATVATVDLAHGGLVAPGDEVHEGDVVGRGEVRAHCLPSEAEGPAGSNDGHD